MEDLERLTAAKGVVDKILGELPPDKQLAVKRFKKQQQLLMLKQSQEESGLGTLAFISVYFDLAQTMALQKQEVPNEEVN